MSGHKSAEETLIELKRTMGDELGETFHRLQNDLAHLHLKWRQFRVLFGTKQERLDLLNAAAGGFFGVVQDMMWDDTLMAISRMTDAPGKGERSRLSVRRLPAMIVDPTLRAKVESAVALAVGRSRFARDWRDRRIAHRDLDHALDPSAKPLAGASRQSVEDSLASLREVLNTIDSAIRQTTYAYEFADAISNAESLLYVIRDGLAARTEHEKAMREGRLPPDKWGPGAAV